MQRIELDNFRVFGSPAGFDLAPVTVLTGKNNSGKSSLIKAFLVLADYLEQDDQTVLRLDGPRAIRYRISRFDDLRNWASESKQVQIAYQSKGYHFSYSFSERVAGGRVWLRKFVLTDVASGAKLELVQFTDEERTLLKLEERDQAFRLVLEQPMLEALLGPHAPWLTEAIELRIEDEKIQSSLVEQEASFAMAEALLQQMPGVSAIELIASEFEKEKASLQQLRDKAQYTAVAVATHVRPAPDTLYKGVVYLSDLHQFGRRLPNLISQGLNRGFVEAVAGNEQLAQQQVAAELVRLVEHELVALFTLSVHHLGVNRTHQARLYLVGETKSEINAVAEAYLRLDASGGADNEFLQHWADRFDIGTNVRVRNFANTAINIVAQRNGKQTNLVDMGFGSGQVLTILLQLAALVEQQSQTLSSSRRSSNPFVLIEEPEANLHPQLQSLLAEMFTEVARKYGFQFILETHSEYLIRNIQVLVKEQPVKDLFKVYYFDKPNEANGKKHGHEMRLRDDGVFMDEFGEGFLVNHAADLAFKLF